jgi:hypothetical protein
MHQPFKRRTKFHLPFANIIRRYTVYGSVHRKYMQQDGTIRGLIVSGNCSTCFGWYFHPTSGAHTTVSTASGICHSTITAICRYRGRVGTGLSVLWVAYFKIHSLYSIYFDRSVPSFKEVSSLSSM